MTGYLKLFRQMLEWEWYKDPNTCRLWIHLLLKANYGYARFHGQDVHPGQLVTSIKHLSEETGLTERQVRTALTHLKSTHEVTCKVTNKYTLITIEKWRFFQVDECETDMQNDNPFDTQVTTIKEE